MRKKIVFSLIFIIPVICFAGPESDQEIDQLIIFQTFSGDWTIADSLLEDQIKKHPESPKYYALKGPYYFYTRYFHQNTLNNDSLIQKMAEYASKAVEVGEKDEMTLDDKFFVGSAYGYLARFYGRQGAFWDAYWAVRNCQKYLTEVLEKDPTYTDAKMGLAVIEYFSATQLRGFMGFVAWVLGMSGNRDTALMQFHDVAENGKWFKYEAQFALAALYRFPVFENDIEQANIISAQLYEKFPQNIWIRTQYDLMRFFALVDERGVEILQTEFDSLETKYHVTNSGILNNFGYNLINQNRIRDAIEVFKANIRLFPDDANGYDSISEAYELAGINDMAIHYTRICLEKLPADSTINDNFKDIIREACETRMETLGANSGKLNI